jgi:prevent-host-death family protein
MKIIKASTAKANLYRLIEETAESSEPVQITGKRASAVLVSEQDWRAIQETISLLSIPGMRESIREGLETPVEECGEEPSWMERLGSHGGVDLAGPVAEERNVRADNEPRKSGRLKGQIHMAEDFDAPLPDDILKAFLDET